MSRPGTSAWQLTLSCLFMHSLAVYASVSYCANIVSRLYAIPSQTIVHTFSRRGLMLSVVAGNVAES